MDTYTLIFETLHGSQAYGLAREESDWDYKGILVGPAAWYHGFVGGPEQIEHTADHVIYEVRKFFRLAANANPNLVEILYTRPEDHTVCTAAGARLVAARSLFLSKKVGTSFGGYALSQLKRIRTHRRWLLTPPKTAPERAAFGLPERSVAPPEQMGAFEALRARGDSPDVGPNFLDLMGRERQYRAARRQWEHYQTWLKSRNPKRAALEAQFGYDTKHALHLIRLLRMAVEILETGEVHVRRADRDSLLAIRDGALSYDVLVAQAEALHQRVRAAAQTSPLPAKPDMPRLDALCQSIVEEVLNG